MGLESRTRTHKLELVLAGLELAARRVVPDVREAHGLHSSHCPVPKPRGGAGDLKTSRPREYGG